jgi:CRISPR-associated endonuclease/helicase Cas3
MDLCGTALTWYWGKADPNHPGEPKWHPLVYHCLDVAAVGVEYLARAPALRQLFAQRLGGEQGLTGWIAFWLALHDLGKFAESFQGQRADLFRALRGRDPAKVYTLRHDSVGWLLWAGPVRSIAYQEGWFGTDTAEYRDGLDSWAQAVTGHHGQPPEPGGFWETHCDRRADRDAVASFIGEVRPLLLDTAAAAIPARLSATEFELASRELSWWMAGIAVLADWVGSNTAFFAYHRPGIPLADYWPQARERAKHALAVAEVLPIATPGELDFAALFPAIADPSPLQNWASDVPLHAGPQIHLLEDVTGAGKTEAAVLLAHRLMASGNGDGFFIGLPTMATANAMYDRIARVYGQLFAGRASLALAHGSRNLVEDFAQSVLPADRAERDPHQQDESASARCAAWLADHNKRALLAPAGVGTLDQVLLAALQSRHQSLRLLGLVCKVLVVDEVHACDAYMLRVLGTVLTFHARAGGSAILLSATLPQAMKQTLLDAFARGCGEARAPALAQPAYPLVTSWSAAAPDTLTETPLATRASLCRKIAVRYVESEEEVVRGIEATLAAGRCVCWLRNTVADALAAHERFRANLPADRLTLFHARFALHDRLDIEKRVLARFGPASGPNERAGQLLIATQVVEQSLDVDFDLVVTDLAPIDRVIQRAGRLHRHVRDARGKRIAEPDALDQRGEPCLWVFGPVWHDEPGADWFKAAFRGAAAVYPNHGQLWLTAKALRTGHFAMPDDARDLIEGVFGDREPIPEGLQRSADRADAKGFADASMAQANTVTFASGYTREGTDWWSDARVPSRLGEATRDVVARWDGDALLPWAEHAVRRHAWAYSTVRVAERLIARAVEPASAARKAAVEAALETLPAKGRWSVLLPLEYSDVGWVGEAWAAPTPSAAERCLMWQYDAEVGLRQQIAITDAEDA